MDRNGLTHGTSGQTEVGGSNPVLWAMPRTDVSSPGASPFSKRTHLCHGALLSARDGLQYHW